MTKKTLICLLLCFAALLSFTSCKAYMEGFVPSGYQKASTDDVPYYFYVPSDWTVVESGAVITAKTNGANVSMTSVTPGKETTLDEYWKTCKEEIASALGTVEFANEEGESMLIDGKIGAKKYAYSAKIGESEYKLLQMLCIKGESIYIFTFTCEAEKYDVLVDQAEGMLSNFSFEIPLTDQEK